MLAQTSGKRGFMNIKKVVVAGAGVLGSQIAFQSAYKGFDVIVWVRSEGSSNELVPNSNAYWAYTRRLSRP